MFSNYYELGDKARKSAVSHFIEEMHKAEETLAQASSRYTLTEEMNNKLIDYYEAENNPDTNDTAEDSIDELFENIPLYHYLNTVFAKTEAEFEDSLMKGLNASYNAFMNLPYTSSMMGDIAVAEPQNAFAHEPYVSQFNIPGKNIKISDSQFGKKVGKHAEDFGLNPSNPESRYLIRNRINEIFIHKTEIRQGLWRGQGKTLPNGANASGQVYFYIQDKDVVVTDLNGNFITIIK